MMFFTLFAFVTFALSNVEEKNNRLLQTNNALLQALKVLTGTETGVGHGETHSFGERNGQTLTVLDDSNENCAEGYWILTNEECKEIVHRVPGLDKSKQEALGTSDDSHFSPRFTLEQGAGCVFDSISKTLHWDIPDRIDGTVTLVCYAPAVVFVNRCSSYLGLDVLNEEECTRLTPQFPGSSSDSVVHSVVHDELYGCLKDENDDEVQWNHGHLSSGSTPSRHLNSVCWGTNFCKQVWRLQWEENADAAYRGILGPVCGFNEGEKYSRLTPNFCLERFTGNSYLIGDSEAMDLFTQLCDGGDGRGDVCAKAAVLITDYSDLVQTKVFRVVEVVCGVYDGDPTPILGSKKWNEHIGPTFWQ